MHSIFKTDRPFNIFWVFLNNNMPHTTRIVRNQFQNFLTGVRPTLAQRNKTKNQTWCNKQSIWDRPFMNVFQTILKLVEQDTDIYTFKGETENERLTHRAAFSAIKILREFWFASFSKRPKRELNRALNLNLLVEHSSNFNCPFHCNILICPPFSRKMLHILHSKNRWRWHLSSLIPVRLIHGFRKTRVVAYSLNLWSDLKLQKLFYNHSLFFSFQMRQMLKALAAQMEVRNISHIKYNSYFLQSVLVLFLIKVWEKIFVHRLCLSENQFFVTTKLLYSHNNSGRHHSWSILDVFLHSDFLKRRIGTIHLI